MWHFVPEVKCPNGIVKSNLFAICTQLNCHPCPTPKSRCGSVASSWFPENPEKWALHRSNIGRIGFAKSISNNFANNLRKKTRFSKSYHQSKYDLIQEYQKRNVIQNLSTNTASSKAISEWNCLKTAILLAVKSTILFWFYKILSYFENSRSNLEKLVLKTWKYIRANKLPSHNWRSRHHWSGWSFSGFEFAAPWRHHHFHKS